MKQKQYSHIFWDWNGTIVDDLAVNHSIINLLLKQYNRKPISIVEYRRIFCFPIREFYKKAGLPVIGDEFEQLTISYWDLYMHKIKEIPLMPGIVELLSTQKDINHYILSACDKKVIINQISMHGIKDHFVEIIAPNSKYACGKTELAKLWINDSSIDLSKAILIGDTLHDYQTSKALGIDCALVNCGHQDLTLFDSLSIPVFNNILELGSAL